MLRLVALVCLVTACWGCLPKIAKCKQKYELRKLIVGGRVANIEDFPYQLFLEQVVVKGGSSICGASIISRQWALTAAHCVVDKTPYTLRAGSSRPDRGGHVHNVARKMIHNSYRKSSYDYDIALLQIYDTFKYSSTVAFVRLPAQGQDVPEDKTAVVSGWGTLKHGGEVPALLQAVDLPIVSAEACDHAHGSDITARMFCAGRPSGGIDSCQGDSGGPMVVDGTQIGIVSWGEGCGDRDCFGVYTKVSEFRDWIRQTAGV